MSNQTTLIDQPVRHGPGSELKAERLRQSLSIDEVVAKLKLSRRQVEALEADRFDDLPGNTFVKGFVRNYAKLLGLNASALVEQASAMLPEDVDAQPTRLEGRMPRITVEPGYGMSADRGGLSVLLMGAAAAVVAGFVVYYVLLRPATEPELHMAGSSSGTTATVETPVEVSPQSTPAETSTPVAVAPVPTGVATPAVEPVTQPATTANPPPPAQATSSTDTVAAPAAQPTATLGGQHAIKLNFNGESWVDIRDSEGKRLASKLFKPGQEEIVQGKPPYKLVVGNATQVTVMYNGKAVDLAPYVKVDVARFELN
ncbi:cytoskeleton protein RodZ [Chitinivorax tropicus]|uniref:Cytoskeleton protein RodZ n=1 Tax=Chitinivorax tropicus TaxID=714531 RepID=A0A840MSN9_9PROT|nr:RodZ domain-containing protein [Chitinivorax tropicus]MBB5019782.1 cytoskeleton protein RodZ [Chitinivorax tropicus]